MCGWTAQLLAVGGGQSEKTGYPEGAGAEWKSPCQPDMFLYPCSYNVALHCCTEIRDLKKAAV